MNLDREKLYDMQYADITQSMFMKIRVREYFEVLAEMFEDMDYDKIVKQFYYFMQDFYSRTYDYQHFDIGLDYLDLTIGEFLDYTRQILFSANWSREEISDVSIACPYIDLVLVRPLIASLERQNPLDSAWGTQNPPKRKRSGKSAKNPG